MDLFGLITVVVVFLVQCLLIFLLSTALFDVLHYLLHRWQQSRIPLLRVFSSWHWVHHRFLNLEMQVDPSLRVKNLFFHVVPEFLTTIAGTLACALLFPLEAVIAVIVLRCGLFVVTVRQEGVDIHHMSMDRISGQQSLFWVGPDYHAMHHIYPNSFFSSFFNVFDLLMGKSCQIRGRRFLVTGASGALGSALVRRIERQGGIVETARHGIDFRPGQPGLLRDKLERADVLVLAHGSKTEDCWNANFVTFTEIIELFEEMGRTRLTPPEIWAVGSEAELHGDFGLASMRDYAASKRAFAARARRYYASENLIYRHIVPSAFTSQMGRGPVPPGFAAAMALFLIKRNFRYVPVTVTTLAFWNYFRFILQPVGDRSTAAPDLHAISEQSSRLSQN